MPNSTNHNAAAGRAAERTKRKETKMKKLPLIFIMLFVLFTVGCGTVEQIYDSENYESLTNERGDIEMFSGGVKLYSYTIEELLKKWKAARKKEDL